MEIVESLPPIYLSFRFCTIPASFTNVHIFHPKEWFFFFFLCVFFFFFFFFFFFYILVILLLHNDILFYYFKKFLENCQNWSFRSMTADLSKNVIFCCFHKCSYYSSKWVNVYILVALLSYHDDFLHFKRFSRKWPNLKFSIDDRGPIEKMWFFAVFKNVHIFHPNEWIVTF